MLRVERDNKEKDLRGTAGSDMPAMPALFLSAIKNTQRVERWKWKTTAKRFLQQKCISLYIRDQNTRPQK